MCLGKDMARFEAKMIARMVLEGLRVRPEPHPDETFTNSPIIFYKHGLKARVEFAPRG